MKTLIRLLFQEQSDLGLHCMHMPFYQKIGVQSFRTYTVFINFFGNWGDNLV